MHRAGALPDRCILCNADAGGYRESRKLYWTPRAWRAVAWLAIIGLMVAGAVTQNPLIRILFWPVVIVLYAANALVRKKVELEFGLCARHRAMSPLKRVVIAVCVIVVLAAGAQIAMAEGGSLVLLVAIGGLLVLAIVGSYGGARALRIDRMTDEHAWLARTGKAFYTALPEIK